MDEQDVIILDNGSGYLKVGFSGEDAPRAVFPTVVGTTDIVETREDGHEVSDSATAKRSQMFFGEEALAQPNAAIAKPVQRGELHPAFQDSLEHLWDYTFRHVLGVEQEELPILIADPLPLGQAAYASRRWMAEMMFEKFKVKSLAIFNSAVLSLFSTGRTRGLVVESGEGLTQAAPVFEGYAIPHAIFKMEVAGHDITTKVMEMMTREIGIEFASNMRVMQALKEKTCSVALEYDQAMKGPDRADEESKSFELPDSTIIQVNRDVRLGAPEILFGGTSHDRERPTIQKVCMEAINTCDLDFRQDLVRSLVVAGGTSMLPGLAPRLRLELGELLPNELFRQVDIIVDPQRKHAAWIGGSMFASLSTFEQVAITRQEFEDGKADVRSLVARKTF